MHVDINKTQSANWKMFTWYVKSGYFFVPVDRRRNVYHID